MSASFGGLALALGTGTALGEPQVQQRLGQDVGGLLTAAEYVRAGLHLGVETC